MHNVHNQFFMNKQHNYIRVLLCLVFFCLITGRVQSQMTTGAQGMEDSEIDSLNLDFALYYAQVYSDNSIDTSNLLCSEFRVKYPSDTSAKARKAYKRAEKESNRKTDSIGKIYADSNVRNKKLLEKMIITIRKTTLKKEPSDYEYCITRKGESEMNWRKIEFPDSNKLIGNFYKLAQIEHYGTYIIHLKAKDGKEQKVTINNYPGLAISDIFLKEQGTELKNKLQSITEINDSVISTLPRVPWYKYCDTSMDNSPLAVIKYVDTNIWNSLKSALAKGRFRPFSLDIPSNEVPVYFLLQHIPDSVYYEYKLVPTGSNDTTIEWKNNGKGNNLIELTEITPGSYTLYVSYRNYFENIMRYKVTIRPLWYQTAWFSFTRGFIIGLFLVFAVFLFYRRRQKQKMRAKEQQRKMIALQVQSFRAQLNPHFIFNALSSIQSLMNKNDLENTNRYLTAFSILLRMTLDERNADLWTLQDELDILDKYISLEQLRFSFDYTIKVGERITAVNIPFPSMLLQPVVENAIKHGISGIKDAGLLTIEVDANKNDLLITVTDNGKGFDTANIQAANHGIRLTRERIAFINETTEGQRIEMKMESGESGTVVSFCFHNYIHG